MNNAFITKEEIKEEQKAVLREQTGTITEVIEAIQHIAGSSYWKVLEKEVFEVDLNKAKRRLAVEKDTTEIFRLQGEIQWAEKFDLEKLLTKYKNDLLAIKTKI